MNPENEVKPIEAVKQIVEEVAAKETEAAPKSSKEWDNFRQARKAERERAEEVARQAKKSQEEAAALKAALDAVLNKPTHQEREEEQEESEEQRIDRRVNAIIAEREAQAQIIRQQREAQEFPERLNREYKDFSQVCSTENLDYLDYHYPEIAQAFAQMPQGYDKWSAIYKAVKRFIPNTDAKKEQSKAEKNFNKPQSISGASVTASGESGSSFKLDEKRKADNWARMQRTMNKVS